MLNEEMEEPLTDKVRAKSKAGSAAKKRSSAGARAVKSAKKKSASKKATSKKKTPGRKKQSLRKVAEQVKEALPDIVEKLVEKAKSGSVQHAKMLLTSTGADKLLEQQCMAADEDESLASLLLRRLDESGPDANREETGTEETESRKQSSTMAAEDEPEES